MIAIDDDTLEEVLETGRTMGVIYVKRSLFRRKYKRAKTIDGEIIFNPYSGDVFLSKMSIITINKIKGNSEGGARYKIFALFESIKRNPMSSTEIIRKIYETRDIASLYPPIGIGG